MPVVWRLIARLVEELDAFPCMALRAQVAPSSLSRHSATSSRALPHRLCTSRRTATQVMRTINAPRQKNKPFAVIFYGEGHQVYASPVGAPC